MRLLFDLDGTLAESHQPVSHEMHEALRHLYQLGHSLYLVTGGGADKTLGQLGEVADIFENVWWCSGSLEKVEWPEALMKQLRWLCHRVDDRGGMLNARLVSEEYREKFASITPDPRVPLRDELQEAWPDYDFQIGGQISIDVLPKGAGKHTVLDQIGGPVIFFGDRTKPGGNDHELAEHVRARGGRVHQVSGPEDTLCQLLSLL